MNPKNTRLRALMHVQEAIEITCDECGTVHALDPAIVRRQAREVGRTGFVCGRCGRECEPSELGYIVADENSRIVFCCDDCEREL